MTPGARIAAAVEILDEIGTGTPAEQALTRWARRSRFAGSGDRAAIRDHVFDVLRRWRSAAHEGRGENGRALMIGLLRLYGVDPATLFTGEGHAPGPLTADEAVRPAASDQTGVRWNLPDWLLPEFTASLGQTAQDTAEMLQTRAPVTLRVNTARTDRDTARSALLAEGIVTAPNPRAETALTVMEGARRVRNSESFARGLVELQDAASQAAVASLPPAARVLDYCAGGGGKALALAVDRDRRVYAHDALPARMADLPARSVRAGAEISILSTEQFGTEAPFDLVLCDVPCSGSGAWRRAPQGKWILTGEALENLTKTQDSILESAAALTAPQGTLAYATCSVLRCENAARIDAFLARNPGWVRRFVRQFPVDAAGDGFFTAHLTRKP